MSQTTLPSLQQRAVQAACRVAEQQRLSFDGADVLRDLSNVVIHLRGTQVVARVATTTAEIRRGDAWLTREVAVASHLAAAGAPVVPPSRRVSPGPHHCDDLVLSFWELIEELDEAPDPRAAGHALRQCHEALSDFEGELPLWGGWHEAVSILPRLEAGKSLKASDLAMLRRVATRVTSQLAEFDDRGDLAWPLQAVHGDAGPANALNTTEGVLWTDWEDCFRGPTAWDLACLVSSARVLQRDLEWSELALEHYGSRVDDARLDCYIEARAFLVTVWTCVIDEQHPEAETTLEARLQWFRERDSQV